jgi:circadian clock protein KaiB
VNLHLESSPELFKGIALFTPGGDLVYCSDPNKQNRWHLHLCIMLRDILGLPEPPHFLVPCYAATVDRWLDAQTGQVKLVAEAAPAVLKYQALLNKVFNTGNIVWQAVPLREEICDPTVLLTYRAQFSELWESHDLIVRYPIAEHLHFRQETKATPTDSPHTEQVGVTLPQPPAEGYVLRLFVSGTSSATERILQNLHQLLEQSFNHPYTLKVIDVTQHPEEAERDQISATPTLVRVWPQPVRRLVGNLDRADQLLTLMTL